MQAPPEQLGSFYLGAEFDLAARRRLEAPLNYDARDLTTHAVCVGMTGSGKTGLCLDLLEEAAIDQVPAMLIDPKGDLSNLLLQFPQLRPEDFEPWVNPDDARRQDRTIAEHAAATAGLWRDNLARWGIGPERIRLLQETADFAIYTPGSNAGLPISILGSLAAPDLDFETHAEAIRERIGSTAVALLGLVGISADPLRSREAILLSNLFEHFWRQGEDLDLARLITAIQNPPIRQLGVFDVDTFYPQQDRFELAMAFNNLAAAPGFQTWLQGEALDVERLLYTADGRPRHAVIYIAHLSDSERMFFVTLLLENVLTWVRRQSGTTSLRALLYFDEIFGFFPPTAEPPSKRPLLTLLKQARAFGLGCVLATQNPVDIDYKGLSNAGTWFIGKLQTERDRNRVLQGLEGSIAGAGGRRGDTDFAALIGQLERQVFLMHNVHNERPLVFQTRWAMSYLRGPLTRPQIQQLMAARRLAPEPAPVAARPAAATAAPTPAVPPGFLSTPPALDPGVPQAFLPLALGEEGAIGQVAPQLGPGVEIAAARLVYEPALLGGAAVRFVDRKRRINEQVEKILLAPAPEDLSRVDWGGAEALPLGLGDLVRRPQPVRSGAGPYFGPVPAGANDARKLKGIARELADWLYYHTRLTITSHPELDVFQRPGESERSFKARLRQAARENRDAEVDDLQRKYATQIDRLETRLRRRERELAGDEAEYEARKQEELITIGETVVGFLIGRRRTRAISTVASKRRLSGRAKIEIEETRQEIADLQREIAELESELAAAAREITRRWADLLDDLIVEELHPRRTDVDVRLLALAWLPSWLVSYREGNQVRTATVAAYPLPDTG